jgi:biotin carboxyl carrier protein
MKLRLASGGAEEEIEILTPGPSCRFRLGGVEREASIEMPEPGVFSVLLDGRSYEARVERTGRVTVVIIDGRRFEIEVRDPRRWLRKSGPHGGAGVETLTAPMPGKVVRVLAAPGEAVEVGQGILVVEAMKMQNELKTTRGGTVVSIEAKEGATVAAGEALAVIE